MPKSDQIQSYKNKQYYNKKKLISFKKKSLPILNFRVHIFIKNIYGRLFFIILVTKTSIKPILLNSQTLGTNINIILTNFVKC